MISGLATEEQTEKAMENVYEKLNTKFGAILMDPPYHKEAFEGALAVIYNAGIEGKCRYFLPVTGLADSGRGAASARRPGIHLLYGEFTGSTECGRRDPGVRAILLWTVYRGERQARSSGVPMYTG